MNTSKKISRISFSFQGCVGRERKTKFQVILIDRIDGHEPLTDDQAQVFITRARRMVLDQKMKVRGDCKLRVNHAEIDDHFESVNLLPKQTFSFTGGER